MYQGYVGIMPYGRRSIQRGYRRAYRDGIIDTIKTGLKNKLKAIAKAIIGFLNKMIDSLSKKIIADVGKIDALLADTATTIRSSVKIFAITKKIQAETFICFNILQKLRDKLQEAIAEKKSAEAEVKKAKAGK